VYEGGSTGGSGERHCEDSAGRVPKGGYDMERGKDAELEVGVTVGCPGVERRWGGWC